ncbi:hypothetical protein [Staphylococcus capitis]|uniref:hypothetical protein n=1 Tax=Staphylococcus capitis TaxID=29388 RepID=UPI00119EFFAB|nr:hypothetical protein [Staphylococcus capitis]
MKKQLLGTVVLSTLLLGACSLNIGTDDNQDEGKKNNEESSEHRSSQSKDKHRNDDTKIDNSTNQANQGQANASENNDDSNSGNERNNNEANSDNQTNHGTISEDEAIQNAKEHFKYSATNDDYKVDPNQSNSKEYYITFTAHDATGYPMKAATTVNKQTGHVNGYIDRRTKADRERHIQHANESSSYKGPDSNNRKAFGKDLSHPNYNDQNAQQSQNENNQQKQNNEDQSQQEVNNDDSSQSEEGTSENEAAQNSEQEQNQSVEQSQDDDTQDQQQQTNSSAQDTDNNQNNDQQNNVEKPESVSRD